MSESMTVQLLELKCKGDLDEKFISKDEFVSIVSESNLPFRDLRMLLKTSPISNKISRHPAILPRHSSRCFILEMENVRLICFSDKCLVINHEDRLRGDFVRLLKEQFRYPSLGTPKNNEDSTMKLLQQNSFQCQEFEQVVLETALDYVVQKYRRHMQIIKPALDMLLQQVEATPETNCLRRLLAVKKSLAEFEQKVEVFSKVVRTLLSDDEDMTNLSLTKVDEKEEIEQILSSISADLEEIETEVKIFIDMIEDTDQYISAHLDAVRNEIIKMTLFIEMGGLTMGTGAVVSGIFGMNLKNYMENYQYGFLIVCAGLFLIMLTVFASLATKYMQMKTDTRSAQSFTLTKNFFSYVDDMESSVNDDYCERDKFKDMVEKVIGIKINDKESEYLLHIDDVNRNPTVCNIIRRQSIHFEHPAKLMGSRSSDLRSCSDFI